MLLSAFTTRMEDPDAQAEEIGRTAARSLAALPLQARQAFLLVSVEEFSPQDAAQVMDVGAPELQRLVDEAGRDIARQIATDVVIIEDEPLIALDLERLVMALGHRVVKIARTRGRVQAAALHKPGLVLATSGWPTQLRPRCRQRHPRGLHGAGGVHHRLPEKL
jgi:predicted DNA-binding protein (UPF0251 family)